MKHTHTHTRTAHARTHARAHARTHAHTRIIIIIEPGHTHIGTVWGCVPVGNHARRQTALASQGRSEQRGHGHLSPDASALRRRSALFEPSVRTRHACVSAAMADGGKRNECEWRSHGVSRRFSQPTFLRLVKDADRMPGCLFERAERLRIGIALACGYLRYLLCSPPSDMSDRRRAASPLLLLETMMCNSRRAPVGSVAQQQRP